VNEPPILEAGGYPTGLPLSESTKVGTEVFVLKGHDPEGSPVKYGIQLTDHFVVNPRTGVITLAKPLNREVRHASIWMRAAQGENLHADYARPLPPCRSSPRSAAGISFLCMRFRDSLVSREFLPRHCYFIIVRIGNGCSAFVEHVRSIADRFLLNFAESLRIDNAQRGVTYSRWTTRSGPRRIGNL